jgi:LysR family transcriptional regulator, transcriptional activator of nhaA
MSATFSYRHLYYFWVVAKEGGMSRAAAKLDVAVQTVSTQVRELERSLGQVLLRPAGRGLALTDAGLAAMRQADQIFQLGEQLPGAVRDAVSSPSIRLNIGVLDILPKLVVWRLLKPVMREPKLRLQCQVDEFDDLLGDLALHRFDLVLADRPAPVSSNLKLYSHLVEESELSWYGAGALQTKARRDFPKSLAHVPVLLPTHHAALRAALDRWFERVGVRPRVVGEFEDSALLETFGASGMGVFPAADLTHDDLVPQYKVQRVGRCDGVSEEFFAVGTEKRIAHPLVQRLVRRSAKN